jgi:hypothetical protein
VCVSHVPLAVGIWDVVLRVGKVAVLWSGAIAVTVFATLLSVSVPTGLVDRAGLVGDTILHHIVIEND